MGPNLGTPEKFVTPIEVATAMWNHGPTMSAAMQSRGIERPRFTATELNDLITYLESEEQVVPTGALYILPGLAGDGRRIFAEKGCVGCHAVRGLGSASGPDLAERGAYRSVLGFAAAMWNKAPAMTAAMQARGLSVPQLMPAEMADLVGYFYSVKYFAEAGDAGRGRRHIRDKGCLECHALGGRGGRTAPDLARVTGLDSPAEVIAALWNHTLLDDEMAGLVSWPVMRPADMADLAAFLQAPSRDR